jgi:hypothetical protein
MLSPAELPTGSYVRRAMRPARLRSARSASRYLPALATAGLATVAAIGCGSSGTVDATRIEKAIEVSVAQQRHVLSIAVCPTGVARQAGKQFTCTVTMANGQQSRFIVTEKDDKGNVHYQAAGTQQ